MDQFDWIKGYISHRFLKKKYLAGQTLAGRKIMTIEEAGKILYDKIIEGVPYMVCRFGSVELRMLSDREAVKIGLKKKIDSENWKRLNTNAGFFPNDENYVEEFSSLYCEAMKKIDLIGIWNNRHEDYMIKKYSTEAEITVLRALEPWYTSGVPWTAALKGKKVLVIHPFAETIRSQYEKRETLFKNREILPEFELKTLKAVQTIADEKDERFGTWFEALEYMHQKTREIDFDAAIIGCGAYGLPLAAKIKQDGRQAIHMGGATQILFGIKGARWDAHPIISQLYNENWVRPNEAETVKSYKTIEGGCYW